MKWWLISGAVVLVLGLAAGVAAYRYYQALTSENIFHDAGSSLYIYPGDNTDSLLHRLNPYLISPESFLTAAKLMRLAEEDVRTGHYSLASIHSNRELINMLRSGRQTPVNVIIHNEQDIPAVSGKISRYLLLDSIRILDCLLDSEKLQTEGFQEESLISLVIPNTYQMYWNINCASLTDRLLKEYHRFWTSERLALADSIRMSPAEVYTLASIVDRETIAAREKLVVAGLYLNRLKIGMRLQADPTVVFANKIPETRRVLYKHLEIDSPYNTYKYAGLPPGPIGIASISGIDAVLKHEKHKYLYMVAKPDNSGLHNFSTNLSEHNRNAASYQRWLNQRGI